MLPDAKEANQQKTFHTKAYGSEWHDHLKENAMWQSLQNIGRNYFLSRIKLSLKDWENIKAFFRHVRSQKIYFPSNLSQEATGKCPPLKPENNIGKRKT